VKEILIALVIAMASDTFVPPYLAVAVAEVESCWDVHAYRTNTNGTIDRGLMQLNSSWFNRPDWADPITNIEYGLAHLWYLRTQTDSWYQAVIAYNCGLSRLDNPPVASLDYVIKVYEVWDKYNHAELTKYTGR
jgi:soluble lytic murein transglycosylase-like protein